MIPSTKILKETGQAMAVTAGGILIAHFALKGGRSLRNWFNKPVEVKKEEKTQEHKTA